MRATKFGLLNIALLTLVIFTMCNSAWATDVGGIISSDTTWTGANFPYNLTGHVQIAEEATLTIGPGVTVIGPNSIQVFGALTLNGNSRDTVVLNDADIVPGNNIVPIDDPFHIDINYAPF